MSTPSNTTPASKPRSTADYLRAKAAGDEAIDLQVEAYQAAFTEKRTESEKFQRNPVNFSVARAIEIDQDLASLERLTESLTPQKVDFLKRENTERFFREHAEGLADALEVDLAAKTNKLPSVMDSLKKWLTELPSKIYSPELTEAEKDALLIERQKREDSAEVLRCNIRDARSAITRYRQDPLAENYGHASGILGYINLG